MIIVKLMGGLGNQMFQYAFARTLSNDKYIYFDHSFLKTNSSSSVNFTARKYELQFFKHIKCRNINPYYLQLILSKSKKYNFIKTILYSKFKYISYINDSNNNEVQNKSNSNTLFYLDGYFQNPTYLERNRSKIIKEFTFPKINIELHKLQFEIENSDSIAIHIRRGDYLKPTINSFHGILPLDYYINSVEYIRNKIDNPFYYIFSDDPDWCAKNLTFIPNKKIISNNNKAWEDMCLMSICKHQIIANSTFSWWGAWLNQNPNKTVIAPKDWFANNLKNLESEALIPSKWIRL